MKKVLNIYKPLGLTPLEIIKKFKEKNPEYRDISMTYAGRLDPMAEGVLILLAGEGVHQKDKYLGLDKEYEAEILFGFKTDTFDILGLASVYDCDFEFNKEKFSQKLDGFKGYFEFSLPPYSSYKIKGKPLFYWAREGKLNEIEIPKRKTKIYDIELLDFYEIGANELQKLIIDKINSIKGDFRQKEIKKQWQKLLSVGHPMSNRYKVVGIRVECSSGTYIRALADKLGGVLLGLKRIRVGEFTLF